MEISEGINEKILQRDGKTISKLFKLNCMIATRNLSVTNFSKVHSPFSLLLFHQYDLIKSPSFEKSLNIFLQFTSSIKEEDDWINPIFKKIAFNTLICCNETQNIEKYAVQLTNVFKQIYFKKENITTSEVNSNFSSQKNIIYEQKSLVFYISAMIFNLYFKINNYRLADNLLLILENNNNKNMKGDLQDILLFNYYKGMLKLYRNNISQARDYINYVFKNCSKKMRNRIFVPFFIVNFMTGKIVKEKSLEIYKCEYLKPLYKKLVNCRFDFSDELRNLENIFLKYNVLKISEYFLDYIILRMNLIKVFKLFCVDNKLEIFYVIEICKMNGIKLDGSDITTWILNIIDKEIVKGYLSISKGVIVFSKVNPFPKLDNLVF
ncbi:hypothetical protein CWI37_0175p0030 [Hamiltosporidium tvaerminnensis]|uniref:PCI domain-containing protein n=1 Tax=Hamiltosporidium tvaerminnensis TaxID=1176355 RepID=A0A4Q9L969_9MICR|nr:hypothetical protein LUQ84_001860 [Hamiltosporidium tvaerminnensis]TBU04164.1 hypothetical protein CWI37_0175p0030 [Hamiltosporidium tvaerminnensis]